MIPALQTSAIWPAGDPPRTTFDPNALGAGVSLSADKLTMTGTSGFTWSPANASAFHKGGKWYFEWEGQGQVYAGLVTTAAALSGGNYPGHDPYGFGIISDVAEQAVGGVGVAYPGHGFGTGGPLTDGAGHVYALAVNLTDGWFAAKQLGGDWWGLAGVANLATGANCDSLPGSFSPDVAVVPRGATNGPYTCRFAFGRPQILAAPPAGFLPWNGG